MKNYLTSLTLIFSSLHLFGQLSTVSPSKISINDTVNIVYNSLDEKAKLNGQATIYARITNYLQDGGIEKLNCELKNQEGKFSAHFKLPSLTASSTIEFYTLNKDDDQASKNLTIYDLKKRKPVKGAYVNALFGNEPDRIFKLEMENYPENYLAYAKYINVISAVKSPLIARTQIEELLETLNGKLSATKNEETQVELWTALCVGYAKVGNLSAAKKILFQLFDHFPVAQPTAFAFSIYNYEYYKASAKQIEEDVKRKIKSIFIEHPSAAIAKDSNVFEYLRNDSTITTSVFEQVLMPLYTQNKMAYYALSSLPELYISRKENLTMARTILVKAIAQFQDGTISHQYRLNNSHYQLYVSLFLLDLAKIDQLEKRYANAIIDASAAIQVISGNSAEGNFLPMMLRLRADAYLQIGNINLAFDDDKKLYQGGDKDAVDSMKRLFPMVNSKFNHFDDFLASLKSGNQQAVQQQLLPNFTGVDLKGNAFSLADLKGKIVVINIWGVNCGPCIAEMPMLNELVEAYKDRTDVIFLGVTADQRKDLVSFFKSRKFSYQVIAEVKQITETFNTNALPVHLVIGRNGEVINRSIGAREDIKGYLRGVIEGIGN